MRTYLTVAGTTLGLLAAWGALLPFVS